MHTVYIYLSCSVEIEFKTRSLEFQVNFQRSFVTPQRTWYQVFNRHLPQRKQMHLGHLLLHLYQVCLGDDMVYMWINGVQCKIAHWIQNLGLVFNVYSNQTVLLKLACLLIGLKKPIIINVSRGLSPFLTLWSMAVFLLSSQILQPQEIPVENRLRDLWIFLLSGHISYCFVTRIHLHCWGS